LTRRIGGSPQPNWILPTLSMPTSLLRGQTSGVTTMVAWPRRSLTTLAGPSRFTPWDDALHWRPGQLGWLAREGPRGPYRGMKVVGDGAAIQQWS
jgi:hypothetical protein